MTPLTGLRVLVVDDDDTNRLVARLFLERAGCLVAEARNALAALEQLAQAPVDCLLLDIGMPFMDGKTLCARLRADPAWQRLRIVAYTAAVVDDHLPTLGPGGFDAIVTKPVEREALLRAVAIP